MGLVSGASAQTWPTVLPLERTFQVKNPTAAAIRTTIRDQAGREAYLFICRNTVAAADLASNYAGDLDCRLMEAANGEVADNLLVETEGEKPWFSRGRMFGRELYGSCASYPEYGQTRTFRLRGMRLTMSFSEVTFQSAPANSGGDAPPLRAYVLGLRVVPDATAVGRIAASSGYLDPQRIEGGKERGCDAWA